jgi:hypothetical protein
MPTAPWLSLGERTREAVRVPAPVGLSSFHPAGAATRAVENTMCFDDDVRDDDFRAELSTEQLDALERRQRQAATAPINGAPLRLVGVDRARLEQLREVRNGLGR